MTNYVYGTSGNDTLNGIDTDNNQMWGYAGNDTITGGVLDDDDEIYGGGGNDIIHGGYGSDYIEGGDGDDEIYDGHPNYFDYYSSDTIYGGAGNDTLIAGEGDDILYGEGGVDTMYGNDGADTFVFVWNYNNGNKDFIQDFDLSEGDILDLDQMIPYDSATDNIADYVKFVTGTYHTTVQVDHDGPGTFHSWINIVQLSNITGLTVGGMISSGNMIVE
ncbi:MAG: type I secretion C-terminal target domain-containing protein [Alphaproteobacteria bacterium]|nr:type I secretion C-terminal target domain-containing protein [Alphaproteobacteria bacterium]